MFITWNVLKLLYNIYCNTLHPGPIDALSTKQYLETKKKGLRTWSICQLFALCGTNFFFSKSVALSKNFFLEMKVKEEGGRQLFATIISMRYKCIMVVE